MMQKKDADFEGMVKRNASLEEAVKQLRNKLEAGDDRCPLNQVGSMSPSSGFVLCWMLFGCLFGRAHMCADRDRSL